MADDLQLGITVACETGAAQDALGELAQEMAGLAKATDGAGGKQKELAKETAEATAKVQAAREAVERAKRAQSEAAAVTQAFGKDSREAAEAVQRMRVAEEAAAKATRAAEVALTGAAKAVSEAAKSADDKARPALLRMNDALQKAGRESDRSAGELRTLEARIHSLGGEANKTEGFLAKFKTGAIMGLGASVAQAGIGLLVDGVKAAGHFALETAVSYETLRTSLTTTTGSSEAAAAAFEHIQKFAAATPFALEEVAGAFIKLKNQGLDPSDRALRAYGDIASAMGKSLDDITEAVLDAAQGEGERLKEFGVRMSKSGDQVALTFRGVTQTVKFSQAEIERYLINLGEQNFAGGMEAQAKTLGGMWSTLTDTAQQFASTLMDAGLSDVLKDIMSEVTALVGGSNELASATGGALASGLRTTWEVLKDLAPLFIATAKAAGWLFDVIGAGLAANDEWAASVQLFGREVETAHDRLKDYARAHGDALGPLGEMVKATFMSTAAQEGYNAAIREGIRAREDQARRDAEIAGLTARRDAETAARLAKLQGEKDARDKAAQMAEFQKLSHDKSLSPSERKRLNELSKALDVPLPKKPKKPKKDTLTAKSHDFDNDVDAFEFETTKDVRKATKDAEVAAFEAESTAREARVTGLEREIELLEARGGLERERVDFIFVELEIANTAADEHEALTQRKLDKEIELARWQANNAKTATERAKALTRAETLEHSKRVAASRDASEKEAADYARKQKLAERVTGTVITLGDNLAAALERAAAGHKGAVAEMLQDLLKSVAREHAVLALGETAKGVASTAATFGIVNPKAAAHFAAAGLHAGVAVAAGVGAYAAGQVADSRQGGGGGGGGFGPAAGGTGGGASRGGSSGEGDSSGGDSGLEAQDVPVSHEQMRRGDTSAGTRSGGHTVNIQGGTFVGVGGMRQVVDMIEKELDRRAKQGGRPKN